MLIVSIGFISGSLLLLTLGFLIKKGMTWLIAGYDPSRVRDEKGLANWVGLGIMTMGAVGILAGVLVYVLPPEYTFLPVILFAVTMPTGAITILCGLRRFVN